MGSRETAKSQALPRDNFADFGRRISVALVQLGSCSMDYPVSECPLLRRLTTSIFDVEDIWPSVSCIGHDSMAYTHEITKKIPIHDQRMHRVDVHSRCTRFWPAVTYSCSKCNLICWKGNQALQQSTRHRPQNSRLWHQLHE